MVIAPKKVAEDTWTREQEKWEHLKNLRVIPVLGTLKKRIVALNTPSDIYVINREIGLTGTPAPNGYIDLWAQVYLLDQGERLEPYITHYRKKYFDPDQRSRDMVYSYKTKEGSVDLIKNKISDICISLNRCSVSSSTYKQIIAIFEWCGL